MLANNFPQKCNKFPNKTVEQPSCVVEINRYRFSL